MGGFSDVEFCASSSSRSAVFICSQQRHKIYSVATPKLLQVAKQPTSASECNQSTQLKNRDMVCGCIRLVSDAHAVQYLRIFGHICHGLELYKMFS